VKDAGAERPDASLAATLLVSAGGCAAAIACTLPFLGRYGWDRDELYFVAAARHPALGYVDFPPGVAWLGRVVIDLFGTSLDALRLTSLLLGLTTVVLVALSVRELGGSWRAQAGAVSSWALSPYLLGSASVFHPTWLDLACQVGVSYLVLRAILRPATWVWPALGIAAGVGLESKYTIGLLLVALVVGLAVTPARAVVFSRGALVAAGIAIVLLVPNLIWQAQHGWVSLHFASSQRAATASDTPPPAYVGEMLLFLGSAAVLAIVGGVHLWRRGALRGLAIAALLVVAGFAVEQGRAYYPLPALAISVAAGAVALERWRPARRRVRTAVVCLLVLTQLAVLAVVAQVVVPVRTTGGMVSSGVWKNTFFKDEIGWPEAVQQVATAWRSLPAATRAHSAILTSNYGEAGALSLYGRGLGLPQPLSGHLSWQYWRPAQLPQRCLLTVGFDPDTLGGLCRSFRILADLQMPYHLANEEQGAPVAFCTLAAPLQDIWQAQIVRSTL
jgi:Dolichyl-phosphate-mannose-protein mannosyltransferase